MKWNTLALRAGIAVAAFVACGSVAFSQSVPPAEVGKWDLLDLVSKTAQAGLYSIGLGIATWASVKIQAWTGIHFEAKRAVAALNRQQYIDSALAKAKAYAETKVTQLADKSRYADLMVEFLRAHNRDILATVDKNGNGIIDWLEPMLPPEALAPPEPAQPLMTVARARRAPTPRPDTATEALAAKLAPRKPETVQ